MTGNGRPTTGLLKAFSVVGTAVCAIANFHAYDYDCAIGWSIACMVLMAYFVGETWPTCPRCNGVGKST